MSGFWAISRYDDVVAIARASERFNNSGGPQFGTSRPPRALDTVPHEPARVVVELVAAGRAGRGVVAPALLGMEQLLRDALQVRPLLVREPEPEAKRARG